LLVLVLLGAGGYAGWRWWDSRGGTSTVAAKPCVTPSHPPAPAPVHDVTIRVLNGTKRNGLAHDVAALLRRRGFHVVGVGNAKRVTRTEIRYAARAEAQARTVAEHFTSALLTRTAATRLTVVLGPDYHRLARPSAVAHAHAVDERGAHPQPPSCASRSPGS
jgi:hypothetical protein